MKKKIYVIMIKVGSLNWCQLSDIEFTKEEADKELKKLREWYKNDTQIKLRKKCIKEEFVETLSILY